MPLSNDDQGKTEKPTPARLAEVRERGDSPLSRELVQGGVLLTAAVLLMWCGGWLIGALAALMRHGLTIEAAGGQVAEVAGAYRTVLRALLAIGPPFIVFVLTLVAATLALGYGQIGLKWSREVLALKFERLNPFTNLRRVLSLQSLVRTAFAAVKLAIIVTVLWLVLRNRLPLLMRLHEMPFPAAAAEIGGLILTLLLWIGAVVTAIALVDLAWQRFDFQKRNMMSRQEVEDERKRTEGDPAVRMRQRRARDELLRQRMMAEVPKADVVITNPTHYSVALRYDRARDAAPVVVAKGADDAALRIRVVAQENGVPLMEDPPLARALFRAVKVGRTIPEKFYQAVATVLGHVYRLKGRTV